MKKKHELQIDVKAPANEDPYVIECFIYIDGEGYRFYTSRSIYEELLRKGIFLRDGKEKDCANVINTSNVFIEKE